MRNTIADQNKIGRSYNCKFGFEMFQTIYLFFIVEVIFYQWNVNYYEQHCLPFIMASVGIFNIFHIVTCTDNVISIIALVLRRNEQRNGFCLTSSLSYRLGYCINMAKQINEIRLISFFNQLGLLIMVGFTEFTNKKQPLYVNTIRKKKRLCWLNSPTWATVECWL